MMSWLSGMANVIALADDRCTGVNERGGKQRQTSKRGWQGQGALAVWRRVVWDVRKEEHLGI